MANFDRPEHERGSMIVVGGILIAIGFFVVCQIVLYRKSLEVAIAIVDATADFMVSTKRIVAISLGYYIVSIIVVALWVVMSLILASLLDFRKTGGPQDRELLFENHVNAMWFFVFVVSLWILFQIDDTQKYIAMVSASTYYFDSNASRDGSASVSTGFKWAYVKNIGSICFGSLVMTLLRLLRLLAEMLVESAKEDGDGAAKCIACIALCCIRCIENIAEYITRLAYAYQSISGDAFCRSAKNGFLLNLKYCAKFYFAITIAGWFIIIGIMFVTLFNLCIGAALYNYVTLEVDDRDVEYFGPAFVYFMQSVLVAMVCLGLFDEAAIAILCCYSVDTDLHGSPRFGPKSYHEKLSKIEA